MRAMQKMGGGNVRSNACKTRRALCEALENRQLLSLTIDIRAADGGKMAAASSVGQVIDLQVWATITGKNGDPTQDGLQDVMGDILSTKLSSASIDGNLAGALAPGFTGLGSYGGQSQDLNGDGDLDVGQPPNQSKFGYFFARSGDSPLPSESPYAVIDGPSLEFMIGTLTYTVTKLNQGGDTDVNFVSASSGGGISGIWREDNTGVSTSTEAGVIHGMMNSGAPLVITDPVLAPAPVAVSSSFYAQQGVPTRITPLSVDTSIDALVDSSVIVTSGPGQGSLALQPDGSLIYTPAAGYVGTDTFVYTVADLDGKTSNPATVTITVGTIASPLAGNVSVNAPLDGFADVPVLASDTAAAGLTLTPSSVLVVSTPQYGTAVVQSDGSILYTAVQGYTGSDSFTYVVSDSLGHLSNLATVSLSVARAPAPSAGNVTVTTAPATQVSINVLPFDTASPGLTINPQGIYVPDQPANGGVSVISGAVIDYRPNFGFTGIDHFTYSISDSAGTQSAPATVTIYVYGGTVITQPQASNASANTSSGMAVTINLLADATPSTFSLLEPSSLSIGVAPGHGTLVLPGDGSVIYTPASNFAGTDSFTYTFQDTSGQTTNSATVTITVLAQLSGKVIGTAGSYRNHGTTIANVFDGNLNTFFDAPGPNGDWVGLDLGAQYNITSINYAPRAGWANRMIGGVFQGSNDPNFQTGVVALATVTTVPPVGSYSTVSVATPSAFRYVRYLSPAGGYGNVAEIQFLGQLASRPLTQLTGTVIGTAGSYQNSGNTIYNVFDANLNTFFDAPIGSGAWVGLDLGSAKTISQISFAPRTGFAYRMLGGVFEASNSPTFSSGVVALYAVTTKPESDVLTTVTLNVTGAYRYVRYLGPANTCCNISEMVLYG